MKLLPNITEIFPLTLLAGSAPGPQTFWTLGQIRYLISVHVLDQPQ